MGRTPLSKPSHRPKACEHLVSCTSKPSQRPSQIPPKPSQGLETRLKAGRHDVLGPMSQPSAENCTGGSQRFPVRRKSLINQGNRTVKPRKMVQKWFPNLWVMRTEAQPVGPLTE